MASATKRQRPRAHAGASEQGKATAQRVIDAARELLMTKGHAQFSVRNVAAQAELHLANVQYYFPTRDDLVRAIVKDIDARYRACLLYTSLAQLIAKSRGVPRKPYVRMPSVGT